MNNNSIIIEGMSGSGKSTIAREICRRHQMAYIPEIVEITDGSSNISLNSANITQRQEYFILADINRTALIQQGRTIMDRYIYSTIAYTYAKKMIAGGRARVLEESVVEIKDKMANSLLLPSTTKIIFFCVTWPTAMKRASCRIHRKKLEWGDKTFFDYMVEGYFYAFTELNASVSMICAEQNKENVVGQIMQII